MSNFFSRLNCPSCGNEIRESDDICPHCGLNLEQPLSEVELRVLAEPYLERARKAFDTGRNLFEGLDNCDQALEYLPESAEAHNLRGLLLDSLGKVKDAMEEYREALRIDPNYQDAKDNLADAEAETVIIKPL